jgi:hypothetical protein
MYSDTFRYKTGEPSGILPPDTNEDANDSSETEQTTQLPPVNQYAEPTTTNATHPDIPAFDISELPNSFFVLVCGARRSGKTTLVEHLLQQIQGDKKQRFTHIFLISGTNAGFTPQIPKKFRSRNMQHLDYIETGQKAVKRHNKKQTTKRRMIKQRTLVIVDDCATSSGACLRNSQALERAALNGRHWGCGNGVQGDPVDGNGVSYIILTQALTACSRRMRLNSDAIFFNNLSSLTESELIMHENGFFTNTSRGGKNEGRAIYRSLVVSKPYRFICVMCCQQNKTTLGDYVRTIDPELITRPRQLFGTASDDEGESDDE